MRQILGLFAGREDAEAVLAAAERGEAADRRNQLCYAHLYLGLYFDATGDEDAAKRHILLAAGPFSMDHFMGRVAGVHAKVRGWPLDEKPASAGAK
jgi:lipoprotein NlpI